MSKKMDKYKKGTAGIDEVIERAVNNLKEDHGIYLTKEEMRELYGITVDYTREKVREGNYATVLLSGLGRAYLQKPGITQYEKNLKDKLFREEDPDVRATLNRFSELKDKIEEHYQENQPKRNVRKSHKWFHVIPTIRKSSSIRGYKMEDIEEIQNNIK